MWSTALWQSHSTPSCWDASNNVRGLISDASAAGDALEIDSPDAGGTFGAEIVDFFDVVDAAAEKCNDENEDEDEDDEVSEPGDST